MTTTPDLVRAVRDHLAECLEGVRVVTRLPDGPRLEDQLESGPVVLLTRGVGGGYVKGERRVMFDVDVLSADEEPMWEVTDRAWRALDEMSAQFIGGVLVDQMRVHNSPGQVGPGQVGHENPNVRRTFATYRMTTRS